jgi:hypothetical protein
MKPGEKVVCVDAIFPTPLAKLFVSLPVKGVTYTIRAIYPGRRVLHPNGLDGADGETGILLEELHNPPDPRQIYHQELGFSSKRFRPLETLPDAEEHAMAGLTLPDLVGVPATPMTFPNPGDRDPYAP